LKKTTVTRPDGKDGAIAKEKMHMRNESIFEMELEVVPPKEVVVVVDDIVISHEPINNNGVEEVNLHGVVREEWSEDEKSG
jgi:hypothetical protein